MMTRLLEEGGELAQWSPILRGWYQAGKIWLTEQSQTRLVIFHEIEDELENKINVSYEIMKTEGLIQE